MADETNAKKKRSIINPVTTGIIGVAAGAMAVTLSDKNKRKELGRMLSKARDKASNLSEMAAKRLDRVDREIGKAKSRIKSRTGK